ncbi:AAA family ATPase [Pseudomonas sp. LPD2]
MGLACLIQVSQFPRFWPSKTEKLQGSFRQRQPPSRRSAYDDPSWLVPIPFTRNFITEQADKAAEAGGYSTLIIDSYSHEWVGSGGCLEINDTIAKQRYKGNTWSAWNETTPRHRKLVDTILTSPLHIICTMRNPRQPAAGRQPAPALPARNTTRTYTRTGAWALDW